MGRLKGCLIVVALLLIIYIASGGPKEQADKRATQTVQAAVSGDRANTSVTPIAPQDVVLIPTTTITDTPIGATLQPLNATAVPDTTIAQVTPRPPKSYYVRSTVNARTCPDTTCESLGKFQQADIIVVDGITKGGSFQGQSLWYRTTINGQTAYVNIALVIEAELVSAPQPTQAPVSVPVGQPPANNNIYVCNGVDDLNCDDFAGGGADAHLAACGNDEDRLDRDGDGDACEPGFN